MKYFLTLLLVLSTAATAQEKYSVEDINRKFELFFTKYTCRDVHRLVTI